MLDPVHQFREEVMEKVKPFTELVKVPSLKIAEFTG